MRALALVLLAGCGYRFAAGGGLPAGPIQVEVLQNRTASAAAGAQFSRALGLALAANGHAVVSTADARVRGEVQGLEGWAAATGPTGGGVGVFRVSATVRLELVTGGRVRCEATLTGTEDYLPARDLLELEARRQAAVERLSRRLMERAARELCAAEDPG